MKFYNCYIEYDKTITEQQYLNCINVLKSLGYIDNPRYVDNTYEEFCKQKFLWFGVYHPENIFCVDNNSQGMKKISISEVLKLKFTVNYLVL